MAVVVERDGEISVEVDWAAKEVAAYTRILASAQASVTGQGERKWSSAAGAAAAVMAGAAVFIATPSPLWITLAFFAGFGAVMAGQWAYYFDMRDSAISERLFAGDPEAFPPRKTTLGNDYLSETSSGRYGKIALSGIKRVSRTEGLMMIWISRADALAIPERCFTTPAAADTFAATLEARVKAASLTPKG